MDKSDAIDWWVMGPKYFDRMVRLEKALAEIDALGNGLRGKDITAYTTLMHCGAIARRALNNEN